MRESENCQVVGNKVTLAGRAKNERVSYRKDRNYIGVHVKRSQDLFLRRTNSRCADVVESTGT